MQIDMIETRKGVFQAAKENFQKFSRSKRAMADVFTTILKIVMVLGMVGIIGGYFLNLQNQQMNELKHTVALQGGNNTTDASVVAAQHALTGNQSVMSNIPTVVTVIGIVLVLSVLLMYLWPMVQQRFGR